MKYNIDEIAFRQVFQVLLNELLLEKNISKYKLAKDLNIAYNQVKSWTSGERLPSLYHFYKLQNYFNYKFTL